MIEWYRLGSLMNGSFDLLAKLLFALMFLFLVIILICVYHNDIHVL